MFVVIWLYSGAQLLLFSTKRGSIHLVIYSLWQSDHWASGRYFLTSSLDSLLCLMPFECFYWRQVMIDFQYSDLWDIYSWSRYWGKLDSSWLMIIQIIGIQLCSKVGNSEPWVIYAKKRGTLRFCLRLPTQIFNVVPPGLTAMYHIISLLISRLATQHLLMVGQDFCYCFPCWILLAVSALFSSLELYDERTSYYRFANGYSSSAQWTMFIIDSCYSYAPHTTVGALKLITKYEKIAN